MNQFFCLIILTCFFACSPSAYKGPADMEEAKMLYQEAKNMGDKVAPILEDLRQQRNSILVQGRRLSKEEVTFVEKVENYMDRFGIWEENAPNIPENAGNIDSSSNDFLQEIKEWKVTIVALEKELTTM